MAFKDVINKLNLSGIGAKLKGLGQKLPFKRKAAPADELAGPDGSVIDVPPSAQVPDTAAAPAAPGEVPTGAIESAESIPDNAVASAGFGAKLRGLGQTLGGLFKKKA